MDRGKIFVRSEWRHLEHSNNELDEVKRESDTLVYGQPHRTGCARFTTMVKIKFRTQFRLHRHNSCCGIDRGTLSGAGGENPRSFEQLDIIWRPETFRSRVGASQERGKSAKRLTGSK